MNLNELVITNCECCGCSVSDERANIAYRVPFSKGGSHTLTNVMLLCDSCFEDFEEKARAKAQEEEDAEFALAEKIDELAFKFLEQLEEENSYLDFLDLSSIKEDFVDQLFYASCTDRISFEDFIRDCGVLCYYWDKTMLYVFATEAGFNEKEAESFVKLFTVQGVEDKIDYDFIEALYEYARRC